MLGLGRLYDIGIALVPVDLSTAGATGKRVSMEGCSGIDIVLLYAVGTDGDDPVPSLQQHTAYTGGTTADLATIDTIYRKSEATLDGDETWVKTTQTAAAIMTAVADTAQLQNIYVIHVPASALDAGYSHISVNEADLSNNAHLGAFFYIKVGLAHPRTPANLSNMLRPGAANA